MFSAKSALLAAIYFSLLGHGLPIRREVPQEHSHEQFLTSVRNSLNLNNPDQIVDPVFGLLGNAGAANGAGNIADPNCLQQATADRAFSNAKAAGDVQGQVDALIFRALERNSLSVGATTAPCSSVQAVNPEIAAIQQHQDPASPNAAEVNKAITLELARQIAAVGGNPQDALKAGTFTPGQIGDPTARGNSCNVLDDPAGCIFTQNLLVPDVTSEEIDAAVAGMAVDNTGNESDESDEIAPPVVADAGAIGDSAAVTPVPDVDNGADTGAENGAAAGGNLQKFTGALGGAAAPAVTPGGRGFVVEGSDDFLNIGAALGRSCDIQKNKCADFANSAEGRATGLTVGQCDQQNNDCQASK